MANKQNAARGAVPKAASKSAISAAAEEQVPLEVVGPGVEHEDHEGGMTDTLAKRGARAVIEHEETGEVVQPDDDGKPVIRAPSVRERQTGMRAAVVQGGYRGRPARLANDATPKEIAAYEAGLAEARGIKPGAKEVPVVANRVGQYPADGRLRARGEAFVYIMGKDEKELPSWMDDPTGAIPTRDLSAIREPTDVTVTLKVAKDGKTVTAV